MVLVRPRVRTLLRTERLGYETAWLVFLIFSVHPGAGDCVAWT